MTDDAHADEQLPSLELFIEILPIEKPAEREPVRPPQPQPQPQPTSPECESSNKLADGDAIRHYCFSIDMRSITFTPEVLASFSANSQFFVQYSYCYFGYSKKVKSSVHRLKTRSVKITFNEGFFAFNFATSKTQLTNTFAKVPIIFELIEKLDERRKLHGTCTLSLNEFAANGDGNAKKISSFNLPVYTPDKDDMAELRVVMCLQDLGVVSSGCQPSMFNSCLPAADSQLDAVAQQYEKLLVEATVELEVWKQQKITQFVAYLEKKEKEYLEGLASEHKAQAFGDREMEMSAREAALKQRENDLAVRMEQLDIEIGKAIQDVRDTFEAKLKEEHAKIAVIETEKRILEEQVSTLLAKQPQPKSTLINGRGTLGRTNSVPGSVRTASKR